MTTSLQHQTSIARALAHPIDRRQFLAGTAAAGIGLATAGTAVRSAFAQDATPASSATPAASGGSGAEIVAAANAFLDTLNDSEREAVLFDWSDTAQKQRWSNFPEGLFERDGLMGGEISEASQSAWLGLMQATLSEDGYARVHSEWVADDVLAAEGTGGGEASEDDDSSTPSGGGPRGNGGPGGSMNYGMQYYWVALTGTPSESEPWQWQWGGHHVTVNATVLGDNLSLNPSFIGVQPATYTDADGNEVRPLGDIEAAAYELVGSLDDAQLAAAVLGDERINLVLGPGEDGGTIAAEGLLASEMTSEQQATLTTLIGCYTSLAKADHAEARLAEVTADFGETWFAWYGGTAEGDAAYFRVAGPRFVIEYSPQSGLGTTSEHIHGIYRDPTNDYGAAFAS